MRGSIQKRGRNSWRIRFDIPAAPGARRKQQTVTLQGTKRQAEAKLADLLSSVEKGTFVEPSKLTVADLVRARLAQWIASGEISDKTAERYGELIANQIVPYIGNTLAQRLKPLEIETWHSTLRTNGRKGGGPLSARTIGHAHRALSKALREAVKFDMVVRNVAGRDGQRVPKVDDEEVEIIPADKIGHVIETLRGRAIFAKAITALFTGMRRGEIAALRWPNTILPDKLIKVRETIEETKKHGLRFKAPKTKAGLRDITLPDIVVDALTEHRRAQLEERMALGLGKLPDDALVFSSLDGRPRSPRNLSGDWAEVVGTLGIEPVTFHALRHTHASQLIDAGVDIVKISKRLGHANPTITLRIYAHLFRQRDDISAEVINTALADINVSRS